MPSHVAHDAVGYGFKMGTDVLEYSKSMPFLRGLVEVAEKPTKVVISSKVLHPPPLPHGNEGLMEYFETSPHCHYAL